MDHFYPNFSGSYFRKVNVSGPYYDHCYLKTQFQKWEDNKTNCTEGGIIHNNETYCSLLSNETNWVYSKGESTVACVVFSLLSIAGFILNLLIILALLKSSSLRKEYLTSFIISLAITDLAFSTFALPIIVAPVSYTHLTLPTKA